MKLSGATVILNLFNNAHIIPILMMIKWNFTLFISEQGEQFDAMLVPPGSDDMWCLPGSDDVWCLPGSDVWCLPGSDVWSQFNCQGILEYTETGQCIRVNKCRKFNKEVSQCKRVNKFPMLVI